MNEEKPSVEEMIESLTGYDEIAIEKAFGAPVNELAETNSSAFARSLIFIDVRRGDQPMDDKAAKHFALGLRMADVGNYFPAAEDEPVPADPTSASGKDDEQPESEPPS